MFNKLKKIMGALSIALVVSGGAYQTVVAQPNLVQGEERLALYQQQDTVNDRIPPKVVGEPLVLGSTQSTVNLLEGVSALDDREGELEVTLIGYETPTKVPLAQLKVGSQVLVYQASDSAGNIGYLYRTVIVAEELPHKLNTTNPNGDLAAPEVSSAPRYVLAGSLDLDTFIRQKENVVAYDNREGDLSYKWEYLAEQSKLDLTKAGKYLVTWQVLDSAHNKAVVRQWVIVVE